ncbi:signal recognition particle receptor subunit beta-like [Mytilus trossulus]|uniref:signal recognition particle receptor subunit beta-like n=1 Tax=Mytilus trossulus TaxID=6551 RepID=UPI003003F320
MGAGIQEQILQYANLLTDNVQKQDPTTIGILVASLVVLLTIVLLVCRGKSNKRSGVLVLGICESGKTLLYTRLVHQNYTDTFSSIASNSGSYQVQGKNKSLRIIDVPGHERLRQTMLHQYKSLARGIIFMVDSSTLQKEIKDVADFLYTALSDSVISYNIPPVLIACNKQDLLTSKGAEVIRSQLEKEMNTLRVTRSASLQQIESSGNNNTFLGKRNKDFSFDDLKPMKVDFVECSLKGKNAESKPEMKDLEDWLIKIA